MSGNEGIKNEPVINNSVVTNVPMNQSTSSSHYFDMIIHSQIASQLVNFNATHGFNMRNVSILLFMLSISELRSGIGEVYKGIKWGIKEYYKPFFGGIYNGFTSFYKYMITPKPKLISIPQEYEFLQPDERYKTIMIELNPMVEFFQGFTNFLESKEEIEFITKKYSIKNEFDVKIENMEKEIQKEIWTDICIQYKDVKISLMNDLDLSFSITHDKRKLIECKGESIESNTSEITFENPENITQFYELINDPIVYDLIKNIHKRVYDLYPSYAKKCIPTTIDIKDTTSMSFHSLLSEFNLGTSTITNHIIKSAIEAILISNKKNIDESIEYQFLRVLKYHYKKLILTSSLFQILLYLKIIQYIDNSHIRAYDINTGLYGLINYKENVFILPGNIKLKIPNVFDTHFMSLKSLHTKIPDIHENTFMCCESEVSAIYFHLHVYLRSSSSIMNKDIYSLLGLKNINTTIKITPIRYLCWIIGGLSENASEKLKSIGGEPFPDTTVGRLSKLSKTDEKPSVSMKLKFQCDSFDKSEREMRDTFQEFMKFIKSMTFLTTNKETKINVYRIRMIKDIKEEMIDNPTFIEYEEKKNQIKELTSSLNTSEPSKESNGTVNITQQSNPNSLILSSVMAEFVKIPIPPKKIKKEIVSKKVEAEQINETLKDFDTLYLRRSDEHKLKSVLTKFNSKKELLKSLGLPNKLCVLLSGLPGVGKSSLIQVLGSYLKKDIYYLSFGGTIESNEDLQAVFDHVIKNCNQGIIVAEDIDAVGKLVHKREVTFNEPNTVDLLDTREEKLSLAYLLNLLQGTLTPDGLIFVATTNHYDKLDDAFTRDGRFDVKIDMKKCDRYQFQKMYQKFIGRPIPEELLEKMSEDKFTPAQFIFHIKDYISEDYEDSVILERFLEE